MMQQTFNRNRKSIITNERYITVHVDEEKNGKKKEENVPQKDKIKYIKKEKLIHNIHRMLKHINKNIKREHQIENPKKLKKSKILLVFCKIFDAQNDYINQPLTNEQLNNPNELLEYYPHVIQNGNIV
eukprot:150612_1